MSNRRAYPKVTHRERGGESSGASVGAFSNAAELDRGCEPKYARGRWLHRYRRRPLAPMADVVSARGRSTAARVSPCGRVSVNAGCQLLGVCSCGPMIDFSPPHTGRWAATGAGYRLRAGGEFAPQAALRPRRPPAMLLFGWRALGHRDRFRERSQPCQMTARSQRLAARPAGSEGGPGWRFRCARQRPARKRGMRERITGANGDLVGLGRAFDRRLSLPCRGLEISESKPPDRGQCSSPLELLGLR
jgi:hypothetical protein